MSVTLFENLVLMSYGRVNPSMSYHMLNLEKEGPELYNNFLPCERLKHENDVNDKKYQYGALRTLDAIASNDFEAFDAHSVEALKKSGKDNDPPVSDILTYPELIMLANGGDLNICREDLDNASKGGLKSMYINPYMALFRRLFGNDWKAMIALHRFLILSPKELQAVFGETKGNQDNITLFEEHDWIFDGLFKDYMGFNAKTSSIMYGLVSLMSKDKRNCAGLWKQLKIPEAKASKYMSLVLLDDPYDIMTIGNIALPEILSKLLVQGFAKPDTSTIAEFACEYLNRLFQLNYYHAPDPSKPKLQIEWIEDFSEKIELDVDSGKLVNPEVFKAHHRFYLVQLIELMANDFGSNPISNLQYIESVAQGCK